MFLATHLVCVLCWSVCLTSLSIFYIGFFIVKLWVLYIWMMDSCQIHNLLTFSLFYRFFPVMNKSFKFLLLFVCLVSYIRIYCQIQDHEDSFLFSSRNFMLLKKALLFRLLIHFKLILYVLWSRISILFFSCWNLVVPVPCVEETILSPLNRLGTIVKSQLTIVV